MSWTTTFADRYRDALKVGDEQLVAALEVAHKQGQLLYADPGLTVREAALLAIQPCSTSELSEDHLGQTIDEAIDFVIDVVSPRSKGSGAGPQWEGPDGTRA